MITAAKLRSHTVKDLAASAKKKGIAGWHAMRKEELVKALIGKARSDEARKRRLEGAHDASQPPKVVAKRSGTATQAVERPGGGKNGHEKVNGNGAAPHADKPKRSYRTERRLREIRSQLTQSKDLSFRASANGQEYERDRVIVMVRDAYWLHAYWEITRQSVGRARAALGQRWHGAIPVLRLYEMANDNTTSSERKIVRDVQVHGGVNNWYLDVDHPPMSFQVDIGYLADDGLFLGLARSNVVVTPQSGAAGAGDGNWEGVAEDFDRIYALSGGYDETGGQSDLKALFEERLRRPMGSPTVTRFGLGAQSLSRSRQQIPFNVDAELIVHGVTDPRAHVTLKGEPVRLESDGTFSVRLNLPDRRQVLPVVASSADGVEQQTIVLAVERNTKTMEPIIREPDA
ncbi:MAG: DUF4912 domain-containing protein [Thermoguttaceae bacterium]